MQRPYDSTTSNERGDRRKGREAETKAREARGKHVIPPVTSVGPLNSLMTVVRRIEDREWPNNSRAPQGGSDGRRAVERLDRRGLIRRRVAERVGQIPRSSGVVAWEGASGKTGREAEPRCRDKAIGSGCYNPNRSRPYYT